MVSSQRKESLLLHLAECVLSSANRDVMYRDNLGIHINPFYLVDDEPIRQTVVELITDELCFEKIQNLASFSDSGNALASIIALKFELPLYVYSIKSNGIISEEPVLRLSGKNNKYALISALTIDDKQISNVISSIENQGGIVVQIISLINEERGLKEIMKKKGISFVSLITLSEIKATISLKIEGIKARIDFIEKNL